VTEEDVRAAFAKYSTYIPSSRRSDVLLGSLLIGMKDKGQIKSLIMNQCQQPEFCSELPHLLAAFEEVVGKKEASTLEVKEGLGVYSKATCYEFHQLLVATISAYANTLGRFCDAQHELNVYMNGGLGRAEMEEGSWNAETQRKRSTVPRAQAKQMMGAMPRGVRKSLAQTDYVSSKPKPVDPQEKVADIWKLIERRNAYAQLLWECTFLLWRIAYSQILRSHLELLDSAEMLHIPTLGKPSLLPSEVKLYPGLNESGGDESRSSSGGRGRAKENDEDETIESYGDDYEFCAMRGASKLAQMFERWMRLHVDHWAALQTVSSTTGSHSATTSRHSVAIVAPNVHISLITVKHPRQYNGEMERWETTIRKLAASPVAQNTAGPHQPSRNNDQFTAPELRIGSSHNFFDAQTVIDLLKKEIDKYVKLEQSNLIFYAFKPKSEARNTYEPHFYGDIHCEALVASLIEFMDDINAFKSTNTDDVGRLKELIQVLFCLHDYNLH
jgi:hypothetical protein